METEEIKNNESSSDNNTKKRGFFKILFNIVFTLLLVIVLVDTIVSVIGMNNINDGKEPIWYIEKKYEEKDSKKETTYNFGLYVVQKNENSVEQKVILRPFFIK